MPEQTTVRKAKKDLRSGKSPTTAAGEFVREEVHHIRAGKHGARSAKQAIAIGLSKARRSGIPLKPKPGTMSAASSAKAKPTRKPVSRTRSRAITGALKREPTSSVSPMSLSRQAKRASAKRSPAARSRSAHKAVAAKSPAVRSAAAKKAAATRRRHSR